MRQYLGIMIFLCVLAGGVVAQQQTPQEMLKRLDQQIAKDPEDAKNYLMRGSLLFDMEQFRRAVADFTKALRLDYQNMQEAYLLRSLSYYALNEGESAMEDALSFRDARPNDPRAHGLLGTLLINQPQDAVDHFTRQIQLDEKNPQAYVNRAWAIQHLHGYEEQALVDYDLALKLNRNYMPALGSRAQLLMRLERPEEALETMNRAVHIMPSEPMLYIKRAFAHLALKDYRRALADNLYVLELAGPQDIALVNISDLFLRQQEWHLAADYAQQAIDLASGSLAYGHANRGEALLEIGRIALDDEQRMVLLQQATDNVMLAREHGFVNQAHLNYLMQQIQVLQKPRN
jgi:tetratricopeptide (TPR) repeat protein